MPKMREPYTNLDEPAPLSQRSLVREISARTHIRGDTVKEILDTLVEVATEEIVNKGAFNLDKLMTVTSHSTQESVTSLGRVPSSRRLATSLSHAVRKLWRQRQKAPVAYPQTYGELLVAYKEQATSGESVQESGTWNPMLDDDE